MVTLAVREKVPCCAPSALARVDIMPARELSRPGLVIYCKTVSHDGEKWMGKDNNTQEYSVQNPDIIIPPPPPKPHHPNRPNSTTYPRNHEPGALNP